MRVLICEDELLIAMLLEDELGDLGYSVAGVASTVTAGLALLQDPLPDFAVVDFQLADGFCYELIAALKSMSIPIVLVTGAQIDPEDVRLAGIDVVTKPLEVRKLTQMFERLKVGVRGASARVGLPLAHEGI